MIDEIWQVIMAEALENAFQVSRGAVAGARFREVVAATASKHGQQYPPTDEKFGDFLKQFSSLLIVLRRPGKDLLVAPADRPELLAGGGGDNQAFIRDDVFEAFTRIPYETPPSEPWYRRDNDTFCWIRNGGIVDETQFLRVPPRTEAQEVEERRAFANLSQYDRIKDELLKTLDTHAALWAFSRVMKEKGLGREWHVFRLQSIVKRIRVWCEEQHVEWRDEWLTPTKVAAAPRVTTGAQREETSQKVAFTKLVEVLSEEDIKRIQVPLDVVLRLLQR